MRHSGEEMCGGPCGETHRVRHGIGKWKIRFLLPLGYDFMHTAQRVAAAPETSLVFAHPPVFVEVGGGNSCYGAMSFTQRKPVFGRPVSIAVFIRALGR